MNKTSIQFLEKLLKSPSPSGYEELARRIWRSEISDHVDKIEGDFHGNSIASINTEKQPRIMLAGHIDEIGFQVKYINEKGYIYFNTIGGFDLGIIPGRKVKIHTKNGEVLGVVGRRAIHLIDVKDREKPIKLTDLYIDIGAVTRDEAQSLVQIGDSVTYEDNFEVLRNNVYVSRAFDDKIGAFVVAEVLKQISKRKNALKASVYGVATVQEEIGVRGAQTSAFGIDPQIGIAIDVTHATDSPEIKAKEHGEINLGEGVSITRGPNINPKVFDLLIKTAQKNNIPYQVEAEGKPTGTDARALQVNRSGVAAGLVSIPCRYMHTFTEIVSMNDVQACIGLLTEFCLSVNSKTNFVL